MHRKSKLQYWWVERQPCKRKNFYLQCHDRNAKNPIWSIELILNRNPQTVLVDASLTVGVGTSPCAHCKEVSYPLAPKGLWHTLCASLILNWIHDESNSRYKNSYWIHFVEKVHQLRNFHVSIFEVSQNRKADFDFGKLFFHKAN